MDFILLFLSVYEILLYIRFISSFFVTGQTMNHPLYSILRMVSDPYLSLFRFRFLQVGVLDFSPILAIGVLKIIQSILIGRITSLSLLLIVIITTLWQFIFFLTIILIIVLLFRWMSFSFSNQSYGNLNYSGIDNILSPISFGICRVFIRRGFMTYPKSLMWSVLILISTCFVFNFFINFLILTLQKLPF